MAGRTVLVTGGAGFIGTYFARALVERGDEVVLLDLRGPGPESEWVLREVRDQIRFVEGDLRQPGVPEAICREHRVTDAVHMASIVNPVYLASHPREALDANAGATINMLDAVHKLGLRRFICFSTIGVLPSVEYEPIDANHPVLLGRAGPGASFYGAAKVASEAFCFAYRQSFGLDFVILRPSAVYGFGMQYPIFIKPMVENSVRGVPTAFEHGRDFPRDYTHVLDVVQLTLKALDAEPQAIKDRIFYAATGEKLVTAGQVAEIVKELVPGASIEIGPGLSEADLVEIAYRGVLDVGAGRDQLGYVPRYASIRDGLAEFIERYREYLEAAQPS